jgi:hypothetical protein
MPAFNTTNPSGHYIYRTVVTTNICTATFKCNNSTFCPHSILMCFVWISEQTAIISLYSINWLVCITERESVYCAVRTGPSHTTMQAQVNCSLDEFQGNGRKTDPSSRHRELPTPTVIQLVRLIIEIWSGASGQWGDRDCAVAELLGLGPGREDVLRARR